MTSSQRFLYRSILFLVVTAAIVGVLYDVLWRSFWHNPALNGLIVAVLLIGIFYNLRRIVQLRPELDWLDTIRDGGQPLADPPRLLTPLAGVLNQQQQQQSKRGRATSLSTFSLRYLLDSISSRLDESRDIARYQTGLLIFLGLLGTFWGLLQTIDSVGTVIGSMSMTSDDLVAIFSEMKSGLQAPLSGMGTAFSSSLFGLAGSLVLGFLDLQATQAQNSFYNDLEEYLSGQTKLSSADSGALGEMQLGAPIPAYVQALLQQTAENLDSFQRSVARSEDHRGQLTGGLSGLNDQLSSLNDHLVGQQRALAKLFESQEALLTLLSRGADGGKAGAMDEQSRTHIRNVDLQMGRLVDEIHRGRLEMTRELRNEIKLVSRTIAIAAGEPQALQE